MAAIDYAAIRRRIAIRRVLELIAYQPTSTRGDQWRGPCPLEPHVLARRGDRYFSVNLARNLFHCFRCRRSGNQLDLWAAITQLPLYPATLDLCRRIGIEPPTISQSRNSKTTNS
jgi:DNA primase